jgi:hypothetical protein
MLEPTIVEKARREGLKAKRKMLFEEYLKSPRNTRLAFDGDSVEADQHSVLIAITVPGSI